MEEIAAAGQIDLNNNLRIWIPPTGRPFWVITGSPNAGPELSDRELALFEWKIGGDAMR